MTILHKVETGKMETYEKLKNMFLTTLGKGVKCQNS